MFYYLCKILIGVPVDSSYLMVAIRDELVDIKETIKEQFQYSNSLTNYNSAAPITESSGSSSPNNPVSVDNVDTVKEEWITIDEALSILKISRGTLYMLRKKGQIASREKNRSVRLLKSDVEEARIWYSIPKGKV